MNFLIILLCILAGIGIGIGIAHMYYYKLLVDYTAFMLKEINDLSDVDVMTDDDVVYENVTVVVTSNAKGNDIVWYRQNNTRELTVAEWEKEKSNK